MSVTSLVQAQDNMKVQKDAHRVAAEEAKAPSSSLLIAEFQNMELSDLKRADPACLVVTSMVWSVLSNICSLFVCLVCSTHTDFLK